MLHEALTGQHCGWRRALQYLDARFADKRPLQGLNARPCILLVDELDLLVTRSQSVQYIPLCSSPRIFVSYLIMSSSVAFLLGLQVLYNLFDWPTRANSRLIVIGKPCSSEINSA